MTRIKIKLRLSTVSGRAGTVYYQISRKKEVRQITTNIRCCRKNGMLLPDVCVSLSILVISAFQ